MRLQPTIKTKILIAKLLVEDYENQLEELKNKRHCLDYDVYRFMYVKLHQAISNNRNKIKKYCGK